MNMLTNVFVPLSRGVREAQVGQTLFIDRRRRRRIQRRSARAAALFRSNSFLPLHPFANRVTVDGRRSSATVFGGAL